MSAAQPLDRLGRRAATVGAVFGAATLAGAFVDTPHFYGAYLLAYVYWISIALGSMGLIMVHHLTGGGWGFIIRRQLEAAASTIPMMAVLLVPLLLGMGELYPWTRAHEGAHQEVIELKSPYLNTPFFLVRQLIYFVVWSTLALCLTRWSARQDETADSALTRRLTMISGPGILLYVLTATFASVDWIMSLEPEWFSTIYGLLFVVCHGLAAFAFATLVTRLLSGTEPLASYLAPRYFHDLGNWLLAFVLLWSYLSFSQFLIIWSGNLPEEVSWYVHRSQHGWQIVAAALVLFHFALPFLVLLSRRSKQQARTLVRIAVWLMAARFVDYFWWIKPALSEGALAIHWLDVTAMLAVGGLWVAVFARQLKRRALVPKHDPRLEEAFGSKEALSHG